MIKFDNTLLNYITWERISIEGFYKGYRHGPCIKCGATFSHPRHQLECEWAICNDCLGMSEFVYNYNIDAPIINNRIYKEFKISE